MALEVWQTVPHSTLLQPICGLQRSESCLPGQLCSFEFYYSISILF